jgi:hypothetical protein
MFRDLGGGSVLLGEDFSRASARARGCFLTAAEKIGFLGGRAREAGFGPSLTRFAAGKSACRCKQSPRDGLGVWPSPSSACAAGGSFPVPKIFRLETGSGASLRLGASRAFALSQQWPLHQLRCSAFRFDHVFDRSRILGLDGVNLPSENSASEFARRIWNQGD